MAVFEYEAMDPGGSVVRGTLEASAAIDARARLRDEGLVPIDVRLADGVGLSGSPVILFSPFGRVSSAQLCLMTRQFASLMAAQVPLSEALTAVERQTESAKLRSVMAAVHARVREGSTLAMALEESPGVFPKIYRSLVAAGEKSGELDRVLERLADYYEQKEELQSKVALAAVYPIFVVGFSLVVITGLMVYVVPKITKVFLRTGQELPWLTKALIWISGFITGWGIPTLLGAAGLLALAWWFVKKDEGRLYRTHLLLLKTPLFGPMIRNSDSTALTHALAILLAGRVPLISSLKAAAGVMGSLPMKRALEEAAEAVTQGSTLARALERTGRLPPLLVQFIATGERNGQLDKMTDLAARQQTRELEAKTAALTGILGPLLIIAMGIMVMLIVLAVLMPIFEMNQLVG